MTKAGLRILLVQQEWTNWQQSRSWAYGAHLGLEHGLSANGIECLTITSVWLSDAKKMLDGQRFDQIWFNDLTHLLVPKGWWEWVSKLAPIRVGWLVESLHYTPEEIAVMPSIGEERRARLAERVGLCTHFACSDEQDAQNGAVPGVPSLWVPFAVPKRFIQPAADIRSQAPATFCGTLYGSRSQWLASNVLAGKLSRQEAIEQRTVFPSMFDWLHRATPLLKLLPTSWGLNAYLKLLRQIRRRMYALWLEGMRQGCAVVNLPHFVKTYTPRVVEGMAAGVPVISWEIPNRPRNRALFENGVEILLFNRDSMEELAAHIDRVGSDTNYARRIASNAQRRLLEYHTVEHRVKEVINWIYGSGI